MVAGRVPFSERILEKVPDCHSLLRHAMVAHLAEHDSQSAQQADFEYWKYPAQHEPRRRAATHESMIEFSNYLHYVMRENIDGQPSFADMVANPALLETNARFGKVITILAKRRDGRPRQEFWSYFPEPKLDEHSSALDHMADLFDKKTVGLAGSLYYPFCKRLEESIQEGTRYRKSTPQMLMLEKLVAQLGEPDLFVTWLHAYAAAHPPKQTA